jgi:hypothetical protein
MANESARWPVVPNGASPYTPSPQSRVGYVGVSWVTRAGAEPVVKNNGSKHATTLKLDLITTAFEVLTVHGGVV